MTAQNGVNTALTRPGRVLPRPFTDGGICPPYGVFKNELYKRHDFNVECRRGYKYENSQHLEVFQIYVNGKCPYPRAKMNGKFPTPRAQKTGKSPTLSRGGPSEIHLILPLYKLNEDKNIYIYIAQKLIFFKQENIDSEFAHFWPKMC